MNIRIYIAAFLLIVSGVAFAENQAEVITLNNRTAEEVLPTVQSLLEQDGSVTTFQNKLIIKTSEQNLQEIKNILATLDTPAKQLLISVKHDNTASGSHSGYSTSGNINAGPHVSIRQNPDGTITETTESYSTVNVYGTQSTRDGNGTQQIQALEGRPAYISVGQQVPVLNERQLYPHGVVSQSIEYKNVNQGFYVTAHLTENNQVYLDISTENDALSEEGGGKIDVQHTRTSVSGQLGQWIALGGVDQSSQHSQDGILHSTREIDSDNRTLYIKVDKIN